MTPDDTDTSTTLTYQTPATAPGFGVSGDEFLRDGVKKIPPSRSNSDPDVLLTVNQVCAITKLRPHTLANWACAKPRKGPPFKKIGRNRFYSERAFWEWFNNQ